MPQITTDICIIGAGSGGLSLAAGAVQMGASVVLFEAGKMGGDCLNTGCVPSKSLLAAGKAAKGVAGKPKMGVSGKGADIDFAAVKNHVEAVIAGIEPHDSIERFESLGVTVIPARARFTGPRQVMGGGYNVRFRFAAIATGSSPVVPPIGGIESVKYHTNETIFTLRDKPDHLLVLGGGPIGLEMAQAHLRLGCKVTLIEALSIMGRDEPELVSRLRQELQTEGLTIIEGAAATKVGQTDDGIITLTLNNGEEIVGSDLLVAVGRRPNINDIGLEEARVKTDRNIIVNHGLRTTNKRIFAMGDVAGRAQFTHMAAAHAGTLIKQMLFGLPAKQKENAVPWVTYTDPELAHVGMTEAQAKDKYGDTNIRVLQANLADNDRARAELRTEGMVQIIVRKKGLVIGGSALGPAAGEMISTLTLAVDQGLKIGALAQMIIPYPTYAEAIKRAAGSYYTASLFSDRTSRIVRFLMKFRRH